MLKMLLHRRAQRAPSTTTRPADDLAVLKCKLRLTELPELKADPMEDMLFNLRERLKWTLIGSMFMSKCDLRLTEEEKIVYFISEFEKTAPMEVLMELDMYRIGAEALSEYRRLCTV